MLALFSFLFYSFSLKAPHPAFLLLDYEISAGKRSTLSSKCNQDYELYGTEYKSSVMIILQVPFMYSCAKPLLRLKVWYKLDLGYHLLTSFFITHKALAVVYGLLVKTRLIRD